MNFLALTGSSYENTARGILYVIYEMLWKLIYYVLVLIDEVANLFYKIAGINVNNGVVENKNIFDQLLGQSIISSWYWLFMIVATALVIIFTVIAIIRSMGTNDEKKKSIAPILKNVGLALVLLLVIGPVVLLLISVVSNIAIMLSSLGNNNISIANILFDNSGNLIKVYNETFSTEFTSFRELGNDFLYELIYNPSTEEGATKLVFHWYIALLGGVFILYNLVVIVIEIVKRIFNIVVLYLASPFAISKLALDDGKSFRTWQNKFFNEFLLLLTQIGTFMLFVALVNVLSNLDFANIASTRESAEVSLLEPSEPASPVDTYSLLNGIGRTLVIMAAISVTRSSAKMLTELLTSKESNTDSLLESVLNKISTRSTPVLRSRTITKTTTITKKEGSFTEPNSISIASGAVSNSQGASSNTSNRSINTNNNISLNQNINLTNRYNTVNNIANREVRDEVKRGHYESSNVNPGIVYINTTRVEKPTTPASTFNYIDEETKKAANSVLKEYNRTNKNLDTVISSSDNAKLSKTFDEYAKAYQNEAKVLSDNYRKFEQKASGTMKSEIATQTKEELKSISRAYRKAQMDYSKTADKLKSYDGERMSTAEALRIKEKADKQRETLMSASNKAAQFYENQKKEEE